MDFQRPRPDKLYHFTSLKCATSFILPKLRLRMNKLEKMNDPKENLRHILEGYKASKDPLNSDYNIFEVLGAKFISEKFRCLCFSTDLTYNNSNFAGYTLQKMWAHYGQEHEGVCLVIDYQKFIKENEIIRHDFHILDDSVSYNNDFHVPINFTPLVGRKRGSNVVDHLDVKGKVMGAFKNKRILDEYFFTKSADWAGESEYRFLCLNANKSIYMSIAGSLEKVIKGLNFPEDKTNSIEQFVDKEMVDKIEYYQWRNEFRLLSKNNYK